MMITLKDGRTMPDLIAVAKGLIGANTLANGGELTTQAANKIISMIFDDPFMKLITTTPMRKLTKDIDVGDVMARQLVRVPQGQEPALEDLADASEAGGKLVALPVQLFPTITLEFLRENKDNPKLLQILETMFAKRITNDLVDLGFNGVADDAAGANRAAKFIRLNKGWFQIMREAPAAQKLVIDPATDGWRATLKAIKERSDTRWREDSVFLMATGDADDYAEEVNQPITGRPMDYEAPTRAFRGNKIIAHPKIAPGTVAFTPLKNLQHGIHVDIRRDREYVARRRALEYTFDMDVDFEVAVKAACVFGEGS